MGKDRIKAHIVQGNLREVFKYIGVVSSLLQRASTNYGLILVSDVQTELTKIISYLFALGAIKRRYINVNWYVFP